MTVVLTKADQVSVEDLDLLTKSIHEGLGEHVPCVPVCSEERILTSGFTVNRFGANAIQASLLNDFWVSLSLRLPDRCVSLMHKLVDEWGSAQMSYINDNVGVFNRNAILETLNSEIDRFTSSLNEMLARTVNDEIARTVNAYQEFARTIYVTDSVGQHFAFDAVPSQFSESVLPAVAAGVSFAYGASAILSTVGLMTTSSVVLAPLAVIPYVILGPLVYKSQVRSAFHAHINKVVDTAKERIGSHKGDIEKYLRGCFRV